MRVKALAYVIITDLQAFILQNISQTKSYLSYCETLDYHAFDAPYCMTRFRNIER